MKRSDLCKTGLRCSNTKAHSFSRFSTTQNCQHHRCQSTQNHHHPDIERVKLCESVTQHYFQEQSCLATGNSALHGGLFSTSWELFVSIVTHICFNLDRYFLFERIVVFRIGQNSHSLNQTRHIMFSNLLPVILTIF